MENNMLLKWARLANCKTAKIDFKILGSKHSGEAALLSFLSFYLPDDGT
jgi:hypothetical protein